MSEQDNVRAVEMIFEALNAHDVNRNSDLIADDFRSDAPGAPGPMTRDQNNAYIQGFIDAFPDLHFETRHLIAQGDFVVINWIGSGTHKGGLRTPTGAVIPPTGKRCVVPGSLTYQFRNGKIVASYSHWDMVTLLAQLGLMPGM